MSEGCGGSERDKIVHVLWYCYACTWFAAVLAVPFVPVVDVLRTAARSVPQGGAAMMCRHQPKPTDADRAVIAEIRANGGSLTLDEYVHCQAFSTVGMSWTRARANRSIREWQAKGRWLDAHAHADGTIYVPRES